MSGVESPAGTEPGPAAPVHAEPTSRLDAKSPTSFTGTLVSIHIADHAGAPMKGLAEATLIAGVGIAGDRYAPGSGYYSSKPDVREITLIELETLEALQRDHHVVLGSNEHRRNLTTKDVPLNHLVGQRFVVGSAILEGGRLNTPCAYLDKLLNQQVHRTLTHRSGLNCRIIRGGTIREGDRITRLE